VKGSWASRLKDRCIGSLRTGTMPGILGPCRGLRSGGLLAANPNSQLSNYELVKEVAGGVAIKDAKAALHNRLNMAVITEDSAGKSHNCIRRERSGEKQPSREIWQIQQGCKIGIVQARRKQVLGRK